MSYSTAALLDDFAIRSFRDTGDQDYVSARLCYRHALIPQFHWASLQALEKYFKCILVLNRIRAPKSHDLGALLAVVNQQGGLELGLSARTAAFLVHLDTYGRHRYFESSWHVLGKELLWLDLAVWDVRRFARPLVPHQVLGHSERLRVLAEELRRIKDSSDAHPQRYEIPGGLLEQILADTNHPARAALVWQNGHFGRSYRKKVKYWPNLRASNSPLTLRPDILDEVLKYVWLPRDVKQAIRDYEVATPR